jgi:maleylacetoacetate isomerase
VELYTYYRSSCSYRVRIALNLKGVAYGAIPVNLLKGEQVEEKYRFVNPQGFLPYLVDGDQGFFQSLAILEYLDETYPDPALLPKSSIERAKVRALAQVIACDTQPIQNLKVLKYLKGTLGVSEEAKLDWIRHFIGEGFATLETYFRSCSGLFSVGDSVTLVDVCLIPQIYNARRFDLDFQDFPMIERVESNLMQLEAFCLAAPETQADAVG